MLTCQLINFKNHGANYESDYLLNYKCLLQFSTLINGCLELLMELEWGFRNRFPAVQCIYIIICLHMYHSIHNDGNFKVLIKGGVLINFQSGFRYTHTALSNH